jgi:hypothetical protein
MNARRPSTVGAKQYKVWMLMATTLIVGILLGFGRWASDDHLPIGFGHVAWQAFPAGWVLTIEYGLLCLMVAAFIRGDRVDALFASAETLVWLGGICLFTAGLYHDHFGDGGPKIWGGSVNGYGSFTKFLLKPSFADLPLLLSLWPMAYAVIVVCMSFAGIMGWGRSFLRWRWILNLAFLVALTNAWIVTRVRQTSMNFESSWLAGSLVVLPALVFTLILARNSDRKIHWINLIAAMWLMTALVPQFGTATSPFPVAVDDALRWMGYGYRMLYFGGLLILGGSVALLLAKRERGFANVSAQQG